MRISTKQVMLLVGVLFVIAAPVLAQTSAPATTATGAPSGSFADAPAPATNRAPSVAGPPTTGGDQVIDKEFVMANGLMLGSSIANVELTTRCLENGACSKVPGGLRSRGALYGVGLPANVGIGVLGYYLNSAGAVGGSSQQGCLPPVMSFTRSMLPATCADLGPGGRRESRAATSSAATAALQPTRTNWT